jgi:hypothetical protein
MSLISQLQLIELLHEQQDYSSTMINQLDWTLKYTNFMQNFQSVI